MSHHHIAKGAFDVPDVPNFVPRKLKPYLFIFFVLIVQFSGGFYLAAMSDMVGSKALLQEDVQMAGYASLVGMSINFALMFRMKFRFSTRIQLLGSAIVLIAANVICAYSDCVPLLVVTCFIAGWFRMQATFACNSTIQLWLTPVRDMAIFFSYVYIIVDGVIQLSGIATIYTAFYMQWEYMHWIMVGILAVMLVLVLIFVKPVRCPMHLPLLGIDWIGALLWSIVMLCFTFICVYGNYYDWWSAVEIKGATMIGLLCLGLNLWRASFLSHPYISFRAMKNRNVVRALLIYIVFFTMMATEHVFEHSYAANILGFDETNLIDLNWYVFAGIVVGVGFTYITFALRKWRYKTMTAIAFAMAIAYLSYFYFYIDYGVEKEMLFLPLFFRGVATVIISIVFLTSILQSGLSFQEFPQALTINGFGSAVLGATLGPAIVGEWLHHVMADNVSLLGANIVDFNPEVANAPIAQLYGIVQGQALIESMKEIYGWLLLVAISVLMLILVNYNPMRPFAIFPKWSTVRRAIKHVIRSTRKESVEER